MATKDFDCVASPAGLWMKDLLQYSCTAHFKDSESSISMEYLAVRAEWCCSWRQLLLRFLALFELLRLVWMLTDSFWQFEELAKVVQQAEVEIYWRKAQTYTACSFELPSHTFTSCFKIPSNVWVNNLPQHTYWTVMPMDSVGTV